MSALLFSLHVDLLAERVETGVSTADPTGALPMLPAVKLSSQENIRRPRRTDARCTSVMAPGV